MPSKGFSKPTLSDEFTRTSGKSSNVIKLIRPIKVDALMTKCT